MSVHLRRAADRMPAPTASENLVNESVANTQRQLRVYVLIDKATVEDLEFGKRPRVKVIIKNFGQTPAYAVTHSWVIGIDKFPASNTLNADIKDDSAGISIVGPGGALTHYETLDEPLSRGHIADLKNDNYAFYVIGTVSYLDVFRHPQTTKYRLFTGGPLGLEKVMASDGNGNTAT